MSQQYAHHYPESLGSEVKVLETAGYDTITTTIEEKPRWGRFVTI